MDLSNLSVRVEPENFVADGTRSSRLDLVFMTEEFLSRCASPVIQTIVGEHAQQGRLSSVNVPDDRHANFTNFFVKITMWQTLYVHSRRNNF